MDTTSNTQIEATKSADLPLSEEFQNSIYPQFKKLEELKIGNDQ